MKPRVGTMVFWNFSGGKATGKILKILASGKLKIPKSSVTMIGKALQPVALVRVYKNGVQTDIYVGHKLSTLQRLKVK